MAWTLSITGIPVCIQLLNDDNPEALDVQHNAEAGENILALAELAAHKVFVRLGLHDELRAFHREDATQEATITITEYAGKGPRVAYTLGKKRALSWVVRHVWQGQHPTPKDKREGKCPIPPTPFRLDALDWEPLLKGDAGYTRSPEAVLVAREEIATRERCIERFYDVAYDLVASRMGLSRRRHYTAKNDAEVFQLTLRGYNLTGVAAELDCTPDMASQRVTFARRRLAAFVEARGVQEIAAWYRDVALTDVRAQQVFVADYVTQQQARLGTTPVRRQKEEWKSRARTKWLKMEQERVVTGQEGEKREASQARMAIAAD
jgi:hypothetical protein